MKKIFILLIFCSTLLGVSKGYTQGGIFHNNAPCSNQSIPNPEPAWDWRGGTPYTFYFKSADNQQVFSALHPSPWYDDSNPNVSIFRYQNPKDYEPEDGWVLVQRDFGTPTQGVNHPYFILYNKYSGVLRIFVAIGKVESAHNKAMIELSFPDNDKYRTGVLEAHAPNPIGNLQPLSAFTNKIAPIQMGNEYGFDLPFWLYADYTMMYDPCTCNFLSKLFFKVSLITDTSLSFTLGGTAVTTINSVGQHTGGGKQGLVKLLDDVGNVINKVDKGISAFEDVEKGIGKMFKAFDEVCCVQVKDVWGFKDLLLGTVKTFSGGSGSVVKGVLGLVNLFVNSKEKEATKPTTMTTQFNLKANGNLTTNYDHAFITVASPGSENLTAVPPTKIQYNNVMGVMNVINPPLFRKQFLYDGIELYGEGIQRKLGDSYLEHYQLDADVDYVINQNVGFDHSISTIQGAIYFEKIADLRVRQRDMVQVIKSPNLIQTNDSTWRTPFMPLSCLKDYVATLDYIYERDFYDPTQRYLLPSPVRPVLKINAILRAVKPNGKTQETQIITRYEMKKGSDNVPVSLLPQDVTYNPQNPITASNSVWNSVTITNSKTDGFVYSFAKPRKISAGKEIVIQTVDTHKYVLLNPNLTLGIEAPATCSATPAPFSPANVAYFCGSNQYTQRAYALRKADDTPEASAETPQQETMLTAYPNPTTGKVTFVCVLEEAGELELILLNLQGQTVATLLKKDKAEAGKHEIRYETTNLKKGVYLYKMRTGTKIEVKKLIVE